MDYHLFCLGSLGTYDVFDRSGEQCTFRDIVTEDSYGMLAKSGHEICRELFGVVRWRTSPGISVLRGEIHITGLRRVQGQFKPLMSLLRIFDLEAPPIIFAIIRDLPTQCKQKSPTLRTINATGTHVGTLSLLTPSRLSEVASGH